jgi:hypothetical protein
MKSGNWITLPDGRRIKPEYGSITLRTKDGKLLPVVGPLRGEQIGQNRQPAVDFTNHIPKPGDSKVVDHITHFHTTGPAGHYDKDIPTADRLHAVSGVGSILDNGGSLQIYVPKESGVGRGGLFRTTDGDHLTDLHDHPVPH